MLFSGTFEIFRRIGPAFNREEIDYLNEESRMTFACFANRFDELLQSGHETIVTNAQQRTTGNIAHAGGFDDERCRSSFSKPAIPIQVVLGNEPVFGRAPGHHRRHPRAVFKLDSEPILIGLKQKRLARFVSSRPARFRYLMC